MKCNYLVIFNGDDGKPCVKDEVFPSLLDAEDYTDTIDSSRDPKVVPNIQLNPKSEGEFSCNDLGDMAKIVEEVRDLLMWSYNGAGGALQVEHIICQALDHMSIAYQHLKIAELTQTAAMGDKP